uniref:peptidylprolyl isomerase n=1 Tax=Ananas comosus var. bracteatus TaxID=296719 RepID=A0A6V7PIC5_ANACO|nr:unnamed protein product [Ananas comosus var. bracteatus]
MPSRSQGAPRASERDRSIDCGSFEKQILDVDVWLSVNPNGTCRTIPSAAAKKQLLYCAERVSKSIPVHACRIQLGSSEFSQAIRNSMKNVKRLLLNILGVIILRSLQNDFGNHIEIISRLGMESVWDSYSGLEWEWPISLQTNSSLQARNEISFPKPIVFRSPPKPIGLRFNTQSPKVHYTRALIDGTKFDSTRNCGTPWTPSNFKLGEGEFEA